MYYAERTFYIFKEMLMSLSRNRRLSCDIHRILAMYLELTVRSHWAYYQFGVFVSSRQFETIYIFELTDILPHRKNGSSVLFNRLRAALAFPWIISVW